VRAAVFEALSGAVRAGIEAEAERLAAYFERTLSLYT
jgi:hypothetical protein